MRMAIVALFFLATISVVAQDAVDFLLTADREEVAGYIRTHDINSIRDSEGRTSLMLLIERFDGDIILETIEVTEDVNAVDHDGWTALMYASYSTDNEATYTKMLEHGADPALATTDDLNLTALMVAIWQNRSRDVVRLLVDHTEDIDWQNADGMTALMLAASFHGDISVVKLLLDRGANTRLKSRFGGDALAYAQKSRFSSLDNRVDIIRAAQK